jgi:hypothetical protein
MSFPVSSQLNGFPDLAANRGSIFSAEFGYSLLISNAEPLISRFAHSRAWNEG